MKKALVVIILSVVIFCLPALSSAYYYSYKIYDDETGGDCIKIGTWDLETKTCTLTTDLLNVSYGLAIIGDGITVDGNGHTISGLQRYRGIDVFISDNATVKNVTVSNFALGIFSFYSNLLTVTDTVIADNLCSTCKYDYYSGIRIYGGIVMGNLITLNTFVNNGYGLEIINGDGNYMPNRIFNNNFIDNITHSSDPFAKPGYSIYYQDLPTGGNYWSADLSNKECNDGDKDGLCDTERAVNVHYWSSDGSLQVYEQGLVDAYPWAQPDGWSINGPGEPEPPKETDPYESLMRKLEAMEHMGFASSAKSVKVSLEKGNAGAAVNKLEALRNKLDAQTDKKITTEEANELIDLILRVIEKLEQP
jgi:hypothetical protein